MELSALLHAAVMSVPFTVKEQLRPTGRDMSNVPSLGLMVVPYSLSSVSLLTSTLPVLGLLLLLGLVVVLLLSGVSVPLSGASLSSLTVTVQVTDSPFTSAVMTALPLVSAVTSPAELTLATVGALLQAAASSVPLTFSSSFSPTFSTRTVRFREIVGVTGVLSGLSMVSSGLSTSVMGGFSPVMASLIWSPKISHTTSAASRIRTTMATGPSTLGVLRLSAARRPRLFRSLPL